MRYGMVLIPDIWCLYDDAFMKTIHRGTPGCVSCSTRSLSHEIVAIAAPPQPGLLVKAELVQTEEAAWCPMSQS